MRLRIPVMIILSLVLMAASSAADTQGGVKYTRLGAEAAGNATGEIPPFEGAKGLKCPADYQKGEYLPNPFRDEKVLFVINAANVDKYKDRLSPGQVARLVKNPNYYMNIYPSHRIYEHPEVYYEATEKNVKTCHLSKDKNMLIGYNGGVPFPYPKNGLEAIWNVKKPWAGNDLETDDCRRVVSPSGKIRKSRWTTKILAFDETRLYDKWPNPNGVTMKILSYYTYPADREGEAALSVGYVDDRRELDVWQYIPTLNRVRRAPTLIGGTQLDGESTVDEMGFDFRDHAYKWNWKLLGKKEMYVPENNYEMWGVDVPDNVECQAGGVNPARLRYELHRVWVVEGDLKKGYSHPYSKRVSYYDEDYWQPVVADRYDKRGNLWRMAEYYQCYNYCTKQRYVIGYIYYNLESGRYEVFGGCRNKNTKTNATDIGLTPNLFTVQALRRMGR